jgi:hypothetical protein
MASNFRICITRSDNKPIYYRPGSHGERDLVKAIVDATLAKGVGLFRGEEHVRQDLTEAIEEVLHDLKAEVEPV